MPSQTFPAVTIRDGAIEQLDELLSSLGARRVFFVYDKPAVAFSGAAAALDRCWSSREVTGFSDFELNPKIDDAEAGAEQFREANPDVIVALGGGSALDMAKLIGILAPQDGKSLDYVQNNRAPERDGVPTIAIPTTSGTGSEATHFAVVYVDGMKYSLAHPFLRPEYVLIDPQLTHSLPPGPTAASGLDALCQAIESIWAVGTTDDSIGYASEALQLALDNLETAVTAPTPEARHAMSRAAHLAGKAIDISKTTAPHALSYGITTRFQVPHGSAVALTVGAFLEFNSQVTDATCTDPRGAEAVRERVKTIAAILGNGSVPEARKRLTGLVEKTGCPTTLGQAGVSESDLPWLVDQVNVERMSNNPRKISQTELGDLLASLL